MENPTVSLLDIFRAYAAIRGLVRHTPLRPSPTLSRHTGSDVYLKLETEQVTGSFKVRGAANSLVNLPEEARRRGVVTISTGNHGRAVAYIGQRLDIPVIVYVPELVLPHKVAAIRRLGAEVRVSGATQDDAEANAQDFARASGMVLVSPFDDPDVIAGQGTIGLELLTTAPDLDAVIVPLSGGGLLGGIATALKNVHPAIRTIGVSMERGPAMVRSVDAGRPIPVREEPTLADSLMGSIGLENRYTFNVIRRTVDEFVLVTEEEIAAAMVYALQEEHLVVEGGGAVGLAALLSGKLHLPKQKVAVVISGGNVDRATLVTLLATRAYPPSSPI